MITKLETEFEFEGQRVQAMIELEVIDLSLPFNRVADALLNRTDNDAACREAAAIAWGTRPHVETAVYVAGKLYHDGCKVGSSSNPHSRISHMVVGSAPDLYIAAAFWSVGGDAFSLERMAINEAGTRGRRFNGEWLSMSPEDAASLIYARAQEVGHPIADSAMHFRNMRKVKVTEYESHVAFIEREWGRQRASYWRVTNPLEI